VLGDVTTQLSHFDFRCQLPLETTKHNLTLAWLETVTETRNRAGTIGDREQDQLFVDKVKVAELQH